MNPATGTDGDHATFCRLCEAFCGIVATVENGRVTGIRPDFENPHSKGHVCIKGVSIHEVTYDPDRLLHPMKRVGEAGEFAQVSWDEALDDIARRWTSIRRDHGDDALASYLGNPTGYSSRAYGAFGSFMAALGSRKMYGAGSQDANGRMVAYYMIHGGPHHTTIPDLPDCDFLLMIGANPLVSNGWMVWEPRWREDLDTIAGRGAVVVVDPRSTETARRYEHLAIRPDGDTFLLIGMLQWLFAEDRVDRAAVREISEGLEQLEAWVGKIDPARIESETGMSITQIAALTRRFVGAKRAVLYGALGLCRGRYGTLGAYLSSVINAVTMRYGAPGGLRFGNRLLAQTAVNRVGGYGDQRTRIGDFPSIARNLAMAMFPADVETEGEGRVRALFCSAGNPVLTAPGKAALELALEKLELHVSLDLYVTETNKYADYILPVTTFLERADWPLIGLHVAMRPFLQYSDAVIAPVGEVREDYAIYEALTHRIESLGEPLGRRLNPDPNDGLDQAVRHGPAGVDFGEQPDGWSMEKLREHPHGVMLEADTSPRDDWPQRIGFADGKLRIWHELAEVEFRRILAESIPAANTLRLIGRRDIRSINSWMHNVDRLSRGQKPKLHIHPDDASAMGIESGKLVEVVSAYGRITVEAEITDTITAGCVSYPHGWGHLAGWQKANRTIASNMNELHGADITAVEAISGMSIIDCQDVTVRPLHSSSR